MISIQFYLTDSLDPSTYIELSTAQLFNYVSRYLSRNSLRLSPQELTALMTILNSDHLDFKQVKYPLITYLITSAGDHLTTTKPANLKPRTTN